MKIHVKLKAGGQIALEETLKVDNYKLEELTEEEVESAVEVIIRNWVNDRIEVDWETEED